MICKEEKEDTEILNDEKCQYIFELKTPSSFKKNLKENVATYAWENENNGVCKKI